MRPEGTTVAQSTFSGSPECGSLGLGDDDWGGG